MKLEYLRHSLRRWDHLGFEVEPDGTPIWGRLGDGRYRGWLHQIMPAYDADVLEVFLQENPFLAPYQHPKAWREFSGFELFSKTLSLYGPHLKSNPPRVWRPMNVVNMNTSESWCTEKFDGLIFGSGFYGKYFYVERRDGQVVAVCRETEGEVFRWPNFCEFLTTEIHRCSEAWNDDGEPDEAFLKSRFGEA